MAKKEKKNLNLEGLRVPPQNIEAESALLGALLIDKDAVIKIADILTPDDFYRNDHGQVFEAILELFEKQTPVDLVTLTDRLESQKKLDNIGGSSYLASLVNGVSSAANITHYANIIREKSILRRLISASSEITEIGFSENQTIAEVMDQSERLLFSVSQKYLKDRFIPIKDILAEAFDRIDKIHRDKGALRGVPTGFRDLDHKLAGLQKSDLIIIAARPSMGKTSFALNIAENIAVEEKIPVAIFSLEMSKEQLVERLLSSQSGIDSWKLRTGNLSDEDFPKIGYAMGVLSEAPIFIDDSPMANVMEIRAKARRLQMENELGLIIIDYLQLMEGQRRSSDGNRVQEISEISRSLKGLARELDLPVIALSQLSRAVEQRQPKIPMLSDLRESGSIEQDADVVMFIYREDYYEKDTDRKGVTDILIRKHRNGPVGEVELMFKPETMRFYDLDRRRDDDQSSKTAPEQVD
jgi:replicative DNA helicase